MKKWEYNVKIKTGVDLSFFFIKIEDLIFEFDLLSSQKFDKNGLRNTCHLHKILVILIENGENAVKG